MKSLLLVTTLDYRYYANNRIHHLVEQFPKRIDRVYLIYKKVYIAGEHSLSSRIKAFLTFRTKTFESHKAVCIEVDPLLNRSDGLSLSVLRIDDPYHPPASRLRNLSLKILSLLGLVGDLMILPSFGIAYLFHVRSKIDIFIGQGPWEMAFGYLLKKLGLVGLLVYDDFDYAPGNQSVSLLKRRLIAWLEKACLKKSDLIVSVGELLKQLREEQIGRIVSVVPNGVDYPLFQEAQKKVPHPPTLIYMGFVSGWAGLDLTFHALGKVRMSFPTVRLLIIGHAPPAYLHTLMTLRDTLGLDQNVCYLGARKSPDLVPYLKESDIGMAVFRPIDLRRYAFSMKIIEYMAAGLPVITTAGTESESVVKKHQCGEAVRFDEADLAACLSSLLGDPEKMARYSDNAMKASRLYSWDDLILNRYYGLIKQCYS